MIITFILYKRQLPSYCLLSVNNRTCLKYKAEMESFKIFILFASISAVFSGGPSSCEPFVSEFLAFQQVWLNLEDNFQNLIVGM